MTMIRGTTELIAHIGFPTSSFKSPLIYNPYFEEAGIDAVVVPLGCRAEHFPSVLRAVFTLTNTRGALITMPHKVAAAAIVDEASPAVRIAGSCNASGPSFEKSGRVDRLHPVVSSFVSEPAWNPRGEFVQFVLAAHDGNSPPQASAPSHWTETLRRTPPPTAVAHRATRNSRSGRRRAGDTWPARCACADGP